MHFLVHRLFVGALFYFCTLFQKLLHTLEKSAVSVDFFILYKINERFCSFSISFSLLSICKLRLLDIFTFVKSICPHFAQTRYDMNSRRVSDISSASAHIESFMTYREFVRIHIDDFKLCLKSFYHILKKKATLQKRRIANLDLASYFVHNILEV